MFKLDNINPHLRKVDNLERLLRRLSQRVDDKEVLVELSRFNATLEPLIPPQTIIQ